MRDVLDWPAAEAADLLGMTTTAVNSALRRARDQIAAALPAGSDAADVTGLAEPDDPARRALLDRYAAAVENADPSALAGLLREDIELEMPPLLTWFAGRDTVLRFVAASLLPGPGLLRLVPVTANGQPGVRRLRAGTGRRVPRARDPGPHGHGHRHRPNRRLRRPVPVRPVRPALTPPRTIIRLPCSPRSARPRIQPPTPHPTAEMADRWSPSSAAPRHTACDPQRRFALPPQDAGASDNSKKRAGRRRSWGL